MYDIYIYKTTTADWCRILNYFLVLDLFNKILNDQNFDRLKK